MTEEQNNLLANFEKLKQAVFIKRPVLKEIVEKCGNKNLIDYARDFLDVNTNDVVEERKEEFIRSFQKVVAEKLGDDVSKSAADQLRKYYFLSTADHHGPIVHPYFLNSNLVTTLLCAEQHDPVLNNVIVLSCANISFSNSTFPRGLLFTSCKKGGANNQQIGFFPNNSETRAARVFDYRSYKEAEIKKVKNRLEELKRTGEVEDRVEDKVNSVLDSIYASPDVLSEKYYSDQITKTNFLLWKEMLKSIGAPEKFNLLYIELESVVIDLFIKNHLSADTIINKILFDEEYRDLYTNIFDGIEGGFSLKNGWGTWMFWGLPKEEKYCKRLIRDGKKLVSEDGKFSWDLTPESIKKGLEDKELFPSSQFSLLVLSLYYGIKCLGGFCQVNYLTAMRAAFVKMLEEKKLNKDLLVCERLQTKELGEDLTIAFMDCGSSNLSLATTLDLIIYGDNNTWNCLIDEAKNITFSQALDVMMPEFYRVMYPEVQRDKELLAISSQDIAAINGLRDKTKASVCANGDCAVRLESSYSSNRVG